MLDRFHILRTDGRILQCGRRLTVPKASNHTATTNITTAPTAFTSPLGGSPTVLLVNGFRSTFTSSSKVVYLEEFCTQQGFPFYTYDHAGHGISDGPFADCTIGQWRDDLAAVVDHISGISATQPSVSPLILVGSSMGLWLSLLVSAWDRPGSINGIIGVGGTINFTQRLAQEFPADVGKVWHRPSRYDTAGYPIYQRLIQSGSAHLILNDASIDPHCPIELIHGMNDLDVPWPHATSIISVLAGSHPSLVTLVKNGDHRLSSPSHLCIIGHAINRMALLLKMGPTGM
ncbi:hypothetical protein BASA50_002261 [Batrachochytrium salamandrivorans]|uniref:Serine aminopeptidase S33 domain-containing protein n=1 Tax=Batrachochytrium salamandrivorans TaxID=1357716 RepID=A0ABQ8FLW6_9FUNG|nr:hypothetical protein BASA60_000018 [Batrachochytrium salamandrivorans]KAH6586058.1 hypothetical protein BASA61_006647 [Batrachochytrium salamandrivorans]KAH6600516.1 hypothetical protein BASA50_002261 [Batrachochytrium salamandrivorans]KAJ1342395.1 hypothetical protein BSLG_003080 [Batrachochytrium salamandrivorans]